MYGFDEKQQRPGQRTRLTGKPLADTLGKPMTQYVFERALKVPGAMNLVVATDDFRLEEVAPAFGGHPDVTYSDLPSGTDRLR